MFSRNKDLYFAVVFQKVDIKELGLPIFMPTSPIIGYPLGKGEVFLDILSGTKYIHSSMAKEMDIVTSFNLTTPIKTIKKNTKSKEYIRETYNALENYIYCYQDDDICIKAMDKKEFEKEYDITLSPITVEYINTLTDSLIKGKITPSEYNNGIYGFGNNDSMKSETINRMIDINIEEAYEKIKSRVISQDEAIKKILTLIYKSRIFKGKQKKSNILVFGPTGVGKTEIFRTIGEIFNIPVHIEDMTLYTEIGYVGKSVEDILRHVYLNANGNLELAENSILVLDEIDKKASNSRSGYDFNKGDVLKSLLKIVEGGIFEVTIDRENSINFDTSNLTVVAAGAFSSLYEATNNIIGFNRNKNVTVNDIDIKALEKYGIPIEFLGRFNSLVRMNSLNKEDFITILKRSECSVLKGFIEEFKTLGIDLNLSERVYERIADKAISYKTGARSLNIVVENIFDDILFDVFKDTNNIESVNINDDILENNKSYVLKKKE